MNKKLIIKRLEKIIIAVLFMVIYFLIIYHPQDPVFIGEFNNKDGSIYIVRCIDVIISVVIFFTVAFWLIPGQLLKTRYLIFTFGSIFLLSILSVIEYGLDRAVLHVFNLPTTPYEISDKMLNYPRRNLYYSPIIPSNILIYLLAFLYGLSKDWISKSRRQNKLEKEKMQANIDFLKSQINPHFFFNALNNIYAITRKNKDNEAGEAIIKLSAVMRYMIYDSDVKMISLNKEVEHIKQYMELVRLKFGPDDPLKLQFTVEGDLDKFQISPLILLPFVENGCKHGFTPTGDGHLKIILKVKDHKMVFQVKNSRYGAREMFRNHPGVGLENVKKRLNLLYPGQHTFQIEESEENFTVFLTIDFKEL